MTPMIMTPMMSKVFKFSAAALTFLLAGCAQNQLVYQPNATVKPSNNYYLQIALEYDVQVKDERASLEGELILESQMRLTAHPEDDAFTLQLINPDTDTHQFGRDREPLRTLLSEPLRLSMDGKLSLEGEQVALYQALEQYPSEQAILEGADYSRLTNLLPLLPPALEKVKGAAVEVVLNQNMRVKYEVLWVTETRVRVAFASQTKGDELLQGWADYDPKTGLLQQMRGVSRIDVSTEKYQGAVQAIVAIYGTPWLPQGSGNFGDQYSYERYGEERAQYLAELLGELLPERSETQFETEFTAEQQVILRPQRRMNSAAYMPVIDYQLLDKKQQPQDAWLRLDAFRRAEFELALGNQGEQPEPVFVKVYSPSYQTQHVEIPVVGDTVTYEHPLFYIKGEKARRWGEDYWDFYIEQAVNAGIGGFSFQTQNNRVVDTGGEYIANEVGYAQRGNQVAQWLNLSAPVESYRLMVRFDENDVKTMPLSWLQETGVKAQQFDLLRAAKVFAARAPGQEMFDPYGITAQQPEPKVTLSAHQLSVAIAPQMKKLCQLNVLEGTYLGDAITWQPIPPTRSYYRSKKNDGSLQFRLTAHQGETWYFYDASADVSVLCAKAQLTPLNAAQDYQLLHPWMIQLQGEYANWTFEQVQQNLQAFDSKGRVLQWMQPDPEADFQLPSIKAWGNIHQVVRLARSESEPVLEQKVSFGPMPQPQK
ncbi:hypothetical protein VST7929_02776 [Vibrio stylophorae]|uniref:Lipoprotein n=1 Tax=Vibrio stylophorae TaxID=659351 RepID=A0ABN8DWX0_9VIBR|nr:hypothetical protein [Vibrio stylophorae]CAH0535115.1 hypothetical protein VST7929_02776 [Vibrio stylophorae]